MQQTLLIFTNVPDLQIAHVIAHQLVEQRLAACVNILPGVQSIYRWQGAVEEATELTLLIKSTRMRYAELETAIKMMHPYQVPEIVAIPVVDGLPAYLGWIEMETERGMDV